MEKEKSSLLKEWSYRSNKSQIGHYITSEKYSKLHYFIGVLLIILTTIVTSSLFIDITTRELRWGLVITSILASVLATVQTFVMPSEKSEIHRAKASKYGALKRKLELYIVTSNGDDFDIFSKQVRVEWDSIADNSPVTPKSIRDKVKAIIANEVEEFGDTDL